MKKRNKDVGRFVNEYRGLISSVSDDDGRAEIALAVLEARLNGLSKGRCGGLDDDAAFRLKMRILSQAVARLGEAVGGGVRGLLCMAIAKTAPKPPTPEERLRRAFGLSDSKDE